MRPLGGELAKQYIAGGMGFSNHLLDWSPNDSKLAFPIPFDGIYIIDIPPTLP